MEEPPRYSLQTGKNYGTLKTHFTFYFSEKKEAFYEAL